jgi:hypothetical protein
VKKSLEKEDFHTNNSILMPQDGKGMYSHYSIVSGDRSNTFTAGMNSKGVKSMGKETVTRIGQYALKDIPFTGFGKFLANEKQDNFSKIGDQAPMRSDPARNSNIDQMAGQDGQN